MKPSIETPQPAISMPSDMSHGREVLSAMLPNTGCISEPIELSAKVRPAAAA